MAKKQTVSAPVASDNGTANKAQAIRDYAAAHPGEGPAAIVKALAAKGVEVNASRVSTVLNRGSSDRVNVETIKKAATFIKSHGDSKKALAAIESVGAFIDACGSSAKAKAALEAYASVAEAVR